jgi:hypothetical protein
MNPGYDPQNQGVTVRDKNAIKVESRIHEDSKALTVVTV